MPFHCLLRRGLVLWKHVVLDDLLQLLDTERVEFFPRKRLIGSARSSTAAAALAENVPHRTRDGFVLNSQPT